MKSLRLSNLSYVILIMMTACQSNSAKIPELVPVPKVDLGRFMGTWYVIANIPSYLEKNCFNAIEQYDQINDSKIKITFSCNKGSFDGKYKENHFTGFVEKEGNGALWKVQPFWPIKLPYIVIELAEDYSYTVIGYPSRDYLWIMAREKTMSESSYREIVERLKTVHQYDTGKILLVPQR